MSLAAWSEIRRRPSPTAYGRRAIAGALVLVLTLVGISFALLGPHAAAAPLRPDSTIAIAATQSDQYGYCPSSGPVYLGIEWNCIAVLNLTAVVLMLGSIALIAYVFRDADAAELPGDSASVPLTEDDWAVEQQRRRNRRAENESPSAPHRGEP